MKNRRKSLRNHAEKALLSESSCSHEEISKMDPKIDQNRRKSRRKSRLGVARAPSTVDFCRSKQPGRAASRSGRSSWYDWLIGLVDLAGTAGLSIPARSQGRTSWTSYLKPAMVISILILISYILLYFNFGKTWTTPADRPVQKGR